MDVYEQRIANLRRLIDLHYGGVSNKFADAAGIKPPMVSRWLSTTTNDPRRMTEQSARAIERKLGLPQKLLDQAPEDAVVSEVVTLMQTMQPMTRYTVLQMAQVLKAQEREAAPYAGSRHDDDDDLSPPAPVAT